MPPTAMPRPTRSELAWLFGPFVAALVAAAGVYAAGGPDAVRRYGLVLAWPFFGLAFLGSLRAAGRGVPPPAALAVTRLGGRPAFAAPPVHRVTCPRLGGFLTYGVVVAVLLVSTWWALVAVGLVVAAALVVAVRFATGAPTVALTADGVVRGYPVRRTVAWDAVGSTVVRAAGARSALDLGVKGRRWRWSWPEVTTGVNLLHLMNVIDYYVAHPERRAAIGGADEQERVRELLATEQERSVAERSDGHPARHQHVHSGLSAESAEPS
ncbi:hypothetical protein ACNTMW_15285 [Planosporangium sp. 12N6]|uniref:hypothetical protein n=1 Tax=Planosporangium spinosum TaxID=3402278 RepID=UPI003CF0233D